MKNHTFIGRLFALALLVTSILPAFADAPKTGDAVAAVWKDGNFYMGSVTSVEEEKANILYEDGDKLEVPFKDVRVLSKTTEFKVGDHVIAAWKDSRMFPGEITAVTEVTCTVKWDDGDTPLEVKKDRMFLSPK